MGRNLKVVQDDISKAMEEDTKPMRATTPVRVSKLRVEPKSSKPGPAKKETPKKEVAKSSSKVKASKPNHVNASVDAGIVNKVGKENSAIKNMSRSIDKPLVSEKKKSSGQTDSSMKPIKESNPTVLSRVIENTKDN